MVVNFKMQVLRALKVVVWHPGWSTYRYLGRKAYGYRF